MDKLYFWRRFVDVLKADADGTPQDEYKIEDVPKILRERVKKITGLPDWKTNPGRSLKTLGDEIDAEELTRADADNTLAGNITQEVMARQAHEARTDNPHAVTAAQTGAVAKAGDTMTGRLTLSADPTTGLHAVPLQYLQAILDARDPKENVRAATTANITLSGVQTVDGVSLAAGDRVLVKNQTTTSQNGIYLVASGAWSRATDANTGAKISGMYVYVSEGTTQAETGWSLYTDGAITLDTTALTYGQTYGPGSVQAGAGLTRSGNQIAVAAAGIVASMIANGSLDVAKFAANRGPWIRVADAAGRTGLGAVREGQLVYQADTDTYFKSDSPDGTLASAATWTTLGGGGGSVYTEKVYGAPGWTAYSQAFTLSWQTTPLAAPKITIPALGDPPAGHVWRMNVVGAIRIRPAAANVSYFIAVGFDGAAAQGVDGGGPLFASQQGALGIFAYGFTPPATNRQFTVDFNLWTSAAGTYEILPGPYPAAIVYPVPA